MINFVVNHAQIPPSDPSSPPTQYQNLYWQPWCYKVTILNQENTRTLSTNIVLITKFWSESYPLNCEYFHSKKIIISSDIFVEITCKQLLINSSLLRIPSWLVSSLSKASSTLSLSCLAVISIPIRAEGYIRARANEERCKSLLILSDRKIHSKWL